MRTKIKIIESQHSIDDLDLIINKWVEDNNIAIQSCKVTITPVHDFFASSAPPMVCNQWISYVATIVYSELEPKPTKIPQTELRALRIRLSSQISKSTTDELRKLLTDLNIFVLRLIKNEIE